MKANISFNKNFNFCVNHLKTYSHQCPETPNQIRRNIEFNTKYSQELSKLNPEYDRAVSKYYGSNVFSMAKSVLDMSERNDVVQLYTTITKHLDAHFNIYKTAEMGKILAEVNEQTDAELDRCFKALIIKFKSRNFYITVEGSPRNTKTKDDFLSQRKNLAQILFNKVSNYMNNSVIRKTKLLEDSKSLLSDMRKNDISVREHIATLKKLRNDNSELAYSLNVENSQALKNMKKCEVLSSLNARCEETATLYKHILSAYEKQSESLQTLYNQILKK